MKLLSAKNKKLLTTIGTWFGIAVLIAAAVRAFRSDGDGKAKLQSFVQDIREMFRISMIAFPFALMLGILTGFWIDPGNVILAINIGTLTTGAAVVSTFNTTYCPKWFAYVAATQLTGVKVTVEGEGVIFDSDANGLNHAGVIRMIGQTTNAYMFTIANGFIPGKNLIWDFTNSAAQTPIVYVDSDETPPNTEDEPRMYLQLLRQAVLANSGINFKNFATLHLPSLAATDQVNVLYKDGTQQTWLRADLQIALGLTQNIVNTPIYTIDNFALRVKEVNIIAASAQTAYIQRWVPSISGGMLNQAVNQM